MLEIECLARDIPDNAAALMEEVAQAVCRHEGIEQVGAYVRIVDDAAIHEINLSERGVDRPTDVLSFPTINYPSGTARDNKKRIRRELDVETGLCFLGDIVISIDRARAQADEYGHSLERELGYLTAHAMLHLCGYDHMQEDEKAVMRAMEERAMSELGLTRDACSDEELFQLACGMLERAYAPYSGYRVGACLLAEDGRIFTGCNVENASYGATVCAERTAIVKAVSEGARAFRAIAIAGDEDAAWPCGICRQTLREFAPDIRVIVGKRGGSFETARLEDLLPHSFGPGNLGK